MAVQCVLYAVMVSQYATRIPCSKHTNSSVNRRPETPVRPKHDQHCKVSFPHPKYQNILYSIIMKPIGPQRHHHTVLTRETNSPDSQQLAPLFPPKSPKQQTRVSKLYQQYIRIIFHSFPPFSGGTWLFGQNVASSVVWCIRG